MTKRKRRTYKSQFSRELGFDEIPLVGIFAKNPLGNFIAGFLLLLMISYFGSSAPTNPFLGDSDFIPLWQQLGQSFNWLALGGFAFFVIGLAIEGLNADSGNLDPETMESMGSSRANRIIERARLNVHNARAGKKSE